METKKVTLATIRLKAGDIAAKAGIGRKEAQQSLVEAYLRLGFEIDLRDPEPPTAFAADAEATLPLGIKR